MAIGDAEVRDLGARHDRAADALIAAYLRELTEPDARAAPGGLEPEDRGPALDAPDRSRSVPQSS